ncbi:hypothetical protein SAMN05216548_101534 [Faunimonas pinastri]|uniref:Uncharacterized protein n=1 Tax=Faunimonas pinastri TaxID=1855383 RepID=A0A1H9AUQ7_9HYPH|nr:hypothetical protein SAMN05216548_101534 [Faunimonas pinastri]
MAANWKYRGKIGGKEFLPLCGISAVSVLPLPVAWHLKCLREAALLRDGTPVVALITASNRGG